MTCSTEEARRALARILRDGLAMQLDRNRQEPPDISAAPMVLLTETVPELVGTILSPLTYQFSDTVDVALVLQDDFNGQRDLVAGQFAGRVEDIIAANRSLDGIVDYVDVDPFVKNVSVFPGVLDIAAVHVPVVMLYCSTRRSGGG